MKDLMARKLPPIWLQVLTALGLGFVTGLLVPEYTEWWSWLGDLFIGLLKMLATPLILVSIISGIASLGTLDRLGTMGLKAVSLYLMTTAIAIPIGLAAALLIAPGVGFDQAVTSTPDPVPPSAINPLDWLPQNPFAALVDGDPLQVIVLSILVGVGCTLAGSAAKPLVDAINGLSAVIYAITDVVVKLAPLGVFALASVVTATFGSDVLLPVLKLVTTVYLGCLIHVYGGLSLLVRLFTELSVIQFWRGVLEAQVVAFSTTTAAGTLPVTMSCVRHNLGVGEEVARFVLPVGTTINMDGTALYQAVVAVFVAQMFGIVLGPADYITIAVTCLLASIGAAAIPGGGLVVLSIVLSSVGLPLEAIGLVAGVDRILDMARTATNVSGDAAVTTIVAHSEDQLSKEIYDAPAE